MERNPTVNQEECAVRVIQSKGRTCNAMDSYTRAGSHAALPNLRVRPGQGDGRFELYI